MDQTTAPGVAGQWSTAGRRNVCHKLQPIRIELPDHAGAVSIYTDASGTEEVLGSPADAAIQVGAVYRLKLSDLPDFPGVELYPTIELLDRLHPPRGREAEFPVPVTFSEQEIRLAIDGRMITKVVYLEQPDRASPSRNTMADRTRIADPRENVLALADEAGRPIAIVRLGSRTPDPQQPDPGFFGMGAPVQLPARPTTPILEPRR
ncbi:MAG: hypothetical protein EXS05_02845 [Planctomycetaceae bacterium]|nr:hypothetical protein [Planctomycetaceae bacterium]